MKRIASLAKARDTLPVKPSRNSQESLLLVFPGATSTSIQLSISFICLSILFFLEFACCKNYIYARLLYNSWEPVLELAITIHLICRFLIFGSNKIHPKISIYS